MDKFITCLHRFRILTKRLLRKPGFVAILVMVPLLVVAMGIVGKSSDSGIVTVALAMQDAEDETACAVVDDLTRNSRLISFVQCDTPAAAHMLVEQGDADAAWIFPADMSHKIQKFVQHSHHNNAFVAVVQREDSVMLRLSHEKLNAVLYPHLSRALYKDYAVSHLTLGELSDAQLDEYYTAVNADGADVFRLVYAASEQVANDAETNYLLAPIRGLLAIMITLGGFAVAMFYMQDESHGTFDRLPANRRFVFSLNYHAAAVVCVALSALLALIIAGLSVSFVREIAAMALYCVITVGFCVAVRLLCRDIRLLGALMPALAVAMIVVCPVFLNIPVPIVGYLLPPYYYLNAIYDPLWLLYMVIYAAVIYAFDYALFRIRAR